MTKKNANKELMEFVLQRGDGDDRSREMRRTNYLAKRFRAIDRAYGKGSDEESLSHAGPKAGARYKDAEGG
jgi:hypothetical protein